MRNSTRSEFGQRLWEAREARGYSQPELASKVGLAQSTVAQLEKSGQGSSAVTKIALTLGVDAHWLATGEGSQHSAGSAFSAELQTRLSQASPEEIRRLENMLRASLDMGPLLK